MKFCIENLARIYKAEITIDGITVIAGYNSTGKSTISKALVSCMRAYSAMNLKIRRQRISTIARALDDIVSQALPITFYVAPGNNKLYELATEITENPTIKLDTDILLSAFGNSFEPSEKEALKKYLTENIDKIRIGLNKKAEISDQEYVTFLVNNQFREIFDQQINTIGASKPSIVDFWGSEEIHIEFVNNRVSKCSTVTLKEPSPFYIEPIHMLDGASVRVTRRKDRSLYRFLMSDDSTSTESMTIDEYTQQEHASQIVTNLADNVMHGRLRSSDDTVLFYDNDFNENISVKNLASGIKSMALISRLIENGRLAPNGLLIIDEPEVNLHPEWQLRFANFLVQLNKELGIQILLTTHSPYFLRALEVYSKQFKVFDQLKLYMTKPCENEELSRLFEVEDMTNSSNTIFRQLYLPLEKL